MEKYNHKKIEEKWQKIWEKEQPWKVEKNTNKKKFYGLIEFPYPSGAGLHVGHVRSNTAMDIIARKRRAEGYNVLYPIGWDAFGLPTENYAIKTGIHPIKVTKQNTDIFRKQLKKIGFSFDWSREINTTNPNYYKWTQWIFLKLYEKGLAYKAKIPINWCTSCKIGLANEEVVDGVCERCGGEVEKREKEQWMLAITKYAERLDKDLDDVDFLEKIKIQQRNWIGRSDGALIQFGIKNSVNYIEIFTTRPDTIFGATYMVLAPEHKLVQELKNKIENWDEVEKYIKETEKKKDIDRTAEGKEKTGIELKGIKAINPALNKSGETNDSEIPIFIADYVLANYGTGAIMAVPAHDERDFEFAKKYNLPIRQVIDCGKLPCTEPNILTNSGKFDGMDSEEAKVKIVKWLSDKENLPEFQHNPMKENVEIKERDNISVILYNPSQNKYAFLKWNDKVNWKTPIGGGIKDNESLINAAKREIKEESGYTNVNFISYTVDYITKGYIEHKNVNRIANWIGLYFEIENDTQEPVSETEKDLHELVWLQEEEVKDFLNTEGAIYHWEEFLKLKKANKLNKKTKNYARMKTTFKLRDWVFSRQRYWGEPIPMVHCKKCGIVPLPEEELPLKLPDVEKYEPTDTGESPLAVIDSWVNTTCPKCVGKAKRETDTMPNWAGSSWYFLRYTDPDNDKELASKENLKYWTPIDWYNGGMEHTTLHLLYSRFWHKFLYDLGVVPTHEPYQKRTSHGMILAEDGKKMSKSLGNVINPDEVIESVGADSLRIYEMFMGPFDQAISWNTKSMRGTHKWLERIWKLNSRTLPNSVPEIETELHKTIKKVTEDIENMKFNTAISQMMIFVNIAEKEGIGKEQYKIFLQLLSPFAPHITAELYEGVHDKEWPKYDENKLKEDSVTIAIQVNGKVRAELEIPIDSAEDEIKTKALKLPQVKKWIGNAKPRKIIVIPNKIVNIVV